MAGLMVAAALPRQLRISWMIALSFCWLATWNLYLPLVVIAFILMHFFCARKKIIWPALIFTLAGFIMFRTQENLLMVGSSFYLLSLLGYTIDSSKKDTSLSFPEVTLLGSFFPLLMAGPVVKGDDFSSKVRDSSMTWDNVINGGLIFAVGFLKLFFLDEGLELLADTGFDRSRLLGVILTAFFVTLKLYVSLSSFADMGRGIARSFGIQVTPSFLPVFFARNPSDFWERWNHTVAGWFREYLVFPSLLKWGRKVPANVIVLVAFFILGLWHGFDFEWIIFGVFNGFMVITGSLVRKHLGDIAGRLLVMFMILGNGYIHIAGDLSAHQGLMGIDVGIGFYVAIISFLLLECIQERTDDRDFYLHYPKKVRITLAIAFLLFWIVAGEHQEPVDPETLPLYFNL